MARPKGTNVAKDLIKGTIGIEEKNKLRKYRKEVVFDYDLKDVLEKESKKRGMTVSGFIKYCVMKEIQ